MQGIYEVAINDRSGVRRDQRQASPLNKQGITAPSITLFYKN